MLTPGPPGAKLCLPKGIIPSAQPDGEPTKAAYYQMQTYLLLVDSQGEFATDSFRAESWFTSADLNHAATVEARNAASAINKFARQFGLSIRYRGCTGCITDRNLHGFTARSLEAEKAERAEMSGEQAA